ncbi:MAG: signal recognition particle protein [Parasporobacterium sp.]|nr:signal recognition particle protein [Parasporobacterium sp.]
MAFENLSDKLQNVFKKLRGKGILTEADVDVALKEVRMALLEADVNFKVVKQFTKDVKERAVGEDVMKSLTPGQMVVKIVNEEMVKLMGGEPVKLTLMPGSQTTIIMMVGLQGSGKTTTAAKLAGQFKGQGKRPLLVACDIYRPAAIEQLKVNGEKVGVPVFAPGTGMKAADIASQAVAHAAEHNNNLVIIDTAGRLQIDEDMMQELEQIKAAVGVNRTLLVVDSMTGQDAVNIAQGFNERIGVDGVILTKLDGDSRGGAALSVRAVTGVPILYAGMGEKLSDLEQFYPDRMTSRILGMGDILSLIEKAEASIDEEAALDMEKRLKKNEFNFEDYLTSMKQMKNMGGMSAVLKMMPGLGAQVDESMLPDEKKLARIEAIIYSMTPEERRKPKLMNPSRKIRIAKGAGVDIAEVNRLIKQMDQAKKMMKQFGGKKGKGLMNGLGGLGGMKGFGRRGFR